MAKRKDHSVLFEVISQRKETPSTPPPSQQAKAAGQDIHPKVIPPTEAPVVDKSGGVLTLNLSYSSCLGLFAAVLILIAVAFFAGRMTAGKDGLIETDTKTTQQADQQKETQDEKSKTAAKPIVRESGKYYLVIESIAKSSNPENNIKSVNEAKRIADYCTKKGHSADVRSWANRYIVWSGKSFDSPRAEEAQNYGKFVEEKLGTEYFKKYRTYRFLQRSSNGKFDPMFLQQK